MVFKYQITCKLSNLKWESWAYWRIWNQRNMTSWSVYLARDVHCFGFSCPSFFRLFIVICLDDVDWSVLSPTACLVPKDVFRMLRAPCHCLWIHSFILLIGRGKFIKHGQFRVRVLLSTLRLFVFGSTVGDTGLLHASAVGTPCSQHRPLCAFLTQDVYTGHPVIPDFNFCNIASRHIIILKKLCGCTRENVVRFSIVLCTCN